MVLLARNRDNYTDVVKEIQASGGRALGIQTDVTNPTSLTSAFDTIKKELSGATAAAAIYNVNTGFTRKPFLEATIDDLDSSLNGAP